MSVLTIDQVHDKLLTIDATREVLGQTEPLTEVAFSLAGDDVAFEVAPGVLAGAIPAPSSGAGVDTAPPWPTWPGVAEQPASARPSKSIVARRMLVSFP